MNYIEFKNVNKEYKMGEVVINALNQTNFNINKGELVVIVGPSGAGKTTALNILGGMDTVTSGEVYVDGKEITKMNNKQLIKYRRDDIGFVFQFYNLVQNLTAKENIVFTAFGVILGLIFGYFLTDMIIASVEIDKLRFIRHVLPWSYLYSAIITVSFSLIVNYIIHFVLKKIDMIESLKSVE